MLEAFGARRKPEFVKFESLVSNLINLEMLMAIDKDGAGLGKD